MEVEIYCMTFISIFSLSITMYIKKVLHNMIFLGLYNRGEAVIHGDDEEQVE